MPAKTALTVSLTPELAEFIAAHVASGRYGSASEVVRDALRCLESRDNTAPFEKSERGGPEKPSRREHARRA
jgi:antitoxin ParD1/3/4